MDHRCGERRPLSATVLIRRRGWAGWVVGELDNLSISGAFVRVPVSTLPLHAQVRLEVPHPGTEIHRLIHCDAMVVRVARGGVGLLFDELATPGLAPLFRQRQRSAGEVAASVAPRIA